MHGVSTNLHVGRLRLQLGQVVGVVLQLLSQVGILHLQHFHLPQQLVVGRRRHAAGATTDLRRRQHTRVMNERTNECKLQECAVTDFGLPSILLRNCASMTLKLHKS